MLLKIKSKLSNLLVIFIYVIFFCSVASANSNLINDIKIKGNDRISEETIILFSEVKINQVLTNDDLNDILKNLYNTNFFENISLKILNNELLIFVEESPIIDRVEYRGIKANKIKEALNAIINLKSRSSYNEYLISEDRSLIKRYLKDIGYYFSTVETLVENLDNNLVKIIHNIELGDKAKYVRLLSLVIKSSKIVN